MSFLLIFSSSYSEGVIKIILAAVYDFADDMSVVPLCLELGHKNASVILGTAANLSKNGFGMPAARLHDMM